MEAELKAVIRERTSYKFTLTHYRSYFETYNRTLGASVLKVRLNIVSIFETFDAVQKAIEVEDREFEAAYATVRDLKTHTARLWMLPRFL